jgi:hypothetical protein
LPPALFNFSMTWRRGQEVSSSFRCGDLTGRGIESRQEY